MGIYAEVKMPTQIIAKYHRIDSVPKLTWDEKGEGNIEISISQFLSLDARLTGASPINRTFKSFKINKELTGFIRYILYRGVLPIIPEFKDSKSVQEDDLKNLFSFLNLLSEKEKCVMILDLQEKIKENPENYRELYNSIEE